MLCVKFLRRTIRTDIRKVQPYFISDFIVRGLLAVSVRGFLLNLLCVRYYRLSLFSYVLELSYNTICYSNW